MDDAERLDADIARLRGVTIAASRMRAVLEEVAALQLSPPDDVAGPEGGECVASWGVNSKRHRFVITARADGSLAWIDERPDRNEAEANARLAVTINRLASHLRAMRAAGG